MREILIIFVAFTVGFVTGAKMAIDWVREKIEKRIADEECERAAR